MVVCVCVGHIDMQTYAQFLQSTFGLVLGLLFVHFYYFVIVLVDFWVKFTLFSTNAIDFYNITSPK